MCTDSRRRKNEEVPEKALGRLIRSGPDGAGASQPKRLSRSSTRGTASSNSDGSIEDDTPQDNSPRTSTRRVTRRGSATATTGTGSSEENSESSKKRKSDESTSSNNNSRKSRRVTFQDGKQPKKKVTTAKSSARPVGTGTYGTRSTRGNGVELLSELPPPTKPKNVKALAPKAKKNQNVKIIKMLTGTLYLYRGESRRAEFVRSKY